MCSPFTYSHMAILIWQEDHFINPEPVISNQEDNTVAYDCMAFLLYNPERPR